jgi:predicted glutamine amidotransferase
MCELFGMSSKLPTNVTFSLSVFGERGGHLGPHRDGWGIAFNEGHDFRIIKESAPASDSACLRFIEAHDFKSRIVISHIRRASFTASLMSSPTTAKCSEYSKSAGSSPNIFFPWEIRIRSRHSVR